MPQNIKQKKEEIKKDLSQLFDKMKNLDSVKNKTELDLIYEEGLKKLNQLYYLNLFHVKNITSLNEEQKKEISDDILKEYKNNLIKFLSLFSAKEK